MYFVTLHSIFLTELSIVTRPPRAFANQLACSSRHVWRFYERQAGIRILPCGTNPDVLGIFRDRHHAGGAREEVQVIHVITWSRHHRVIPTADENSVSIGRSQSSIRGMLPGI